MDGHDEGSIAPRGTVCGIAIDVNWDDTFSPRGELAACTCTYTTYTTQVRTNAREKLIRRNQRLEGAPGVEGANTCTKDETSGR